MRVHHVMLKGISLARPSVFLQKRAKCYFRTRFTRRYGSVVSRVGKVRMRSQIAKDLFNVKAKSHGCRKYMKVPSLRKDVMSGSNVSFSQKESKVKTETRSLESSSVYNNEIDDLFACFGL